MPRVLEKDTDDPTVQAPRSPSERDGADQAEHDRRGFQKRKENGIAAQFDKKESKKDKRKNNLVTADHEQPPQSVKLPQDTHEMPPRKIHNVKLPNGNLSFIVVEDGRGKDKKPGLALEITKDGKPKVFDVVDDKALVRDKKTGRMMIRVWNTNDQGLRTGDVRKYDPLAKRFIDDKSPTLDTVVDDLKEVEEAEPEEYAKTFTDVVADHIDDDVKNVKVGQYDTSKLSQTDQDNIEDEDAPLTPKRYVITEIVCDDQTQTESLHVLREDMARAALQFDLPVDAQFVIKDGVVEKFDSARHSRSEQPAMDAEQTFKTLQQANEQRPTSEQVTQNLAALKNSDTPSYLFYAQEYRDRVNAFANNNNFDPALRGFATQASAVIDGSINGAIPLDQEQAQLRQLEQQLEALRNNNINNQDYVRQANQLLSDIEGRLQEIPGPTEVPRQTTPAQRELREELRRERRDFKQDEYYLGATIDEPEFIGFSTREKYLLDQNAPGDQLIDLFRREYQRVTENEPDQVLRQQRRELSLLLQRKFAENPNLELYIDPDPANIDLRRTIPDPNNPNRNIPNPNYSREVHQIVLRDRRETVPPPVPPLFADPELAAAFGQFPYVFDNANPDPEMRARLTIAQYADLKQRQERWVNTELRAAFESTNEDEVNRSLQKVGRAEESFIDSDLSERVRALVTLIRCKQQFKNSGPEGFGHFGTEFQKRAPYLMRLPGVAEILAEIEDREFNLKYRRNPDGTVSALRGSKTEQGSEVWQAYENLRQKDGRLNNEAFNVRDGLQDLVNVDEGVDRLLSIDPEQTVNKDKYQRIRRSILRSANENYKRWQGQRIIDLRTRLARTQNADERVRIEEQMNTILAQKIDQSSMEVAEWIWRMSGRSALFGCQDTKGESDFYEVANYPRWAIEKQKSNGNATILNVVFGTADIPTAREFLPGMADGKSYGLHTGFYDYFTNYSILEPGQQVKTGLASKGLVRDGMTNREMALVRKVYRENLNIEPDQAVPSVGSGRSLSAEAAARLTNDEQLALAKWHYQPVLHIGLDSWQKMRDDDSIWGDWSDYGQDYGKARKGNDTMNDFLGNPEFEKVKAMQAGFWGRKAWRFKGEGARRMLGSMLEYRTIYNRSDEMLPNWDARLVNKALSNSYESGLLSKYEKQALEKEFYGSRIVISNDYPIIRHIKKQPWVIRGNFDWIPGWTLAGKYGWWVTKPAAGIFTNIGSVFGKFFKYAFHSPK